MHDSVQGMYVPSAMSSMPASGWEIFIVGREMHRKLHYHSLGLRSGRSSMTSKRTGIAGVEQIREDRIYFRKNVKRNIYCNLTVDFR